MTTADHIHKAKGSDAYLIVGAGPGGLIAARAFKRAGIAFEIVEKYKEVGGIWNINHPGSPMYESCNFIASKKRGGFIGYPMPEHFMDFPTSAQIRQYIHDMARDYGITPMVRFNTEVTAAEPLLIDGGPHWSVEFNGSGERQIYRGVIYAGGHEWKPFVPDIAGIETFPGRVIHSQQYRSTAEFLQKRVLVIGAGNSGVDIASDAAVNATKATISTRRGYWFLPKQVFGVPVTEYIDGSELPARFSELNFHERIELLLQLVGDLTRFGLPSPDHALTATHPIVSNTVLHHLSHSRLYWKPDVARVEGTTVHFKDGSSEDFDVIVLATGYDIEIGFVQEGLIEYRNGRPVTHLSTFFPGLENLYAVGIMHAADNGYQNFDEFVQFIVADIRANLTGENAEAMHQLKNDYCPDLRGDIPLVETRRNENQYAAPAMRKMLQEVQERFNVVIPEWDDAAFYQHERV